MQERTSLKRFHTDRQFGAPWKGIRRLRAFVQTFGASPVSCLTALVVRTEIVTAGNRAFTKSVFAEPAETATIMLPVSPDSKVERLFGHPRRLDKYVIILAKRVSQVHRYEPETALT